MLPSHPRPPQSRMFCRQNPLGTRLGESRSRPAQGALGSPAGPRGGGEKRPRAAGWGWGQDFALCLSLQSHRPKPDPMSEPGSQRGAGSPSGVL